MTKPFTRHDILWLSDIYECWQKVTVSLNLKTKLYWLGLGEDFVGSK